MDKNTLYRQISYELAAFERLVRDHEATAGRARRCLPGRSKDAARVKRDALDVEVKASRRKLKELIADIS